MFNLYHICYAHLIIFTWNLRGKNVNFFFFFYRPGAELQVSGLFLQFMCAPLYVVVVLLCVVVGASLVFWSFLVFFFSILRPFFLNNLFEIVFWCFFPGAIKCFFFGFGGL